MGDRSEKNRLQLKRQSGWFAAGQEVNCALQLLSDAAFKLFVWLCMHAERSRGTLSTTPPELAKALGKNEGEVHIALQELQRQGVCSFRADHDIEISDRFGPYQREADPAVSDDSRHYVAEVKRLFLAHRCVQSTFTAADEKLALSLYRRGVSLIHIERAILLGVLRKYLVLEKGRGTLISSLHYFAQLFEEVQEEISPQYWMYVARKLKALEQRVAVCRRGGAEANEAVEKA